MTQCGRRISSDRVPAVLPGSVLDHGLPHGTYRGLRRLRHECMLWPPQPNAGGVVASRALHVHHFDQLRRKGG